MRIIKEEISLNMVWSGKYVNTIFIKVNKIIGSPIKNIIEEVLYRKKTKSRMKTVILTFWLRPPMRRFFFASM